MPKYHYISKGKVVFDDHGGAVRIFVDFGLCHYYKAMVERRFWLQTNFPKHKPHITIVNPKIHTEISNWDYAKKKWNGQYVKFTYDPYIKIGGKGKGFRNFWIHVQSPDIDAIKRDLRVKKSGYGDHLTICNTKGLQKSC